MHVGTVGRDAAFVGVLRLLTFSTATAIVVSVNWILTSLAAIVVILSSYFYLLTKTEYGQYTYVMSFIICWGQIVFAAYFCEKKFKTEYIKNKHNEELH
jgi:uncharacterized membrane protein